MTNHKTYQPGHLLRNVNAAVTIMARDIILSLKSPSTLVMSFSFPVVMLGLLGGGLIQNLAPHMGFDYGSYAMVGTVVNMLFMLTTLGMVSLVEDRQSNFTQEMLVAPISRVTLVVGKIFGSMFSAIIGLVGTVVVGLFMRLSMNGVQLLKLLLLAPLFCLAAGAIALIVISLIQNTRTASLVASLLVLPQTFLSGTIIPINHGGGILAILSRLLPMTYCNDLARAFLYAGTKQYAAVVRFNPVVSLVAISGMTVVVLCLGTVLFSRAQTRR